MPGYRFHASRLLDEQFDGPGQKVWTKDDFDDVQNAWIAGRLGKLRDDDMPVDPKELSQ